MLPPPYPLVARGGGCLRYHRSGFPPSVYASLFTRGSRETRLAGMAAAIADQQARCRVYPTHSTCHGMLLHAGSAAVCATTRHLESRLDADLGKAPALGSSSRTTSQYFRLGEGGWRQYVSVALDEAGGCAYTASPENRKGVGSVGLAVAGRRRPTLHRTIPSDVNKPLAGAGQGKGTRAPSKGHPIRSIC